MTARQRLVYPDLLRIIAMLAVVLLHVASRDLFAVRLGSPAWQVMNVYDGASRWCVPIYVMVSGLFLLKPTAQVDDLRLAYRKTVSRALRLGSVLVIWTLVYRVFLLRISGQSITIESTLAGLWRMWFAPGYYHLWFLYMLVPLYFLAPLVQLFIARTNPGQRLGLLLVLGVGGPVLTFVVSLVGLFAGQGLYRMMPEFTGYLFYFYLGWWLGQAELGRRWRLGLQTLGVLGVAVTVLGTACVARLDGEFKPLFYDYLSLPTALAAVAVFVTARQFCAPVDEGDQQPRWQGLVETGSAVTLGIYLVHPAVIEAGLRLSNLSLAQPPMPTVLMVPVVTLATFVASSLIAWLGRLVLTALPRGRRWVSWVM